MILEHFHLTIHADAIYAILVFQLNIFCHVYEAMMMFHNRLLF